MRWRWQYWVACAAALAGAWPLSALLVPAARGGDAGAGTAIEQLAHQGQDIPPGLSAPPDLLPGGSATTQKTVNADIFSHPSRGIGFEGEARFKIGNAIFKRQWVSAPASTTSSDGLGPLYNARGCQNCHLKDGRGHPPEANWPADDAVSMVLRLSIPPQTAEQARLLAGRRANSIPDPVYGSQLQDLSIQGHDAEGRIHVTTRDVPVTLNDGTVVTLRRPDYRVEALTAGPLHRDVMVSPRIAPQMIGLGLLEAIPEAQIRVRADPEDANGDGISGRANDVWSLEHDRVMLGRFGWKAGSPTIRQQSAEAFLSDIGLSTPLLPRPAGDCNAAQAHCRGAPHGGAGPEGVEVGGQLLDLVTFYAQNLAVPARRNARAPEVIAGETQFRMAGCAACHTPTQTTGRVDGQPHLSNQVIWPYTDLLLHDMGEGLADHLSEGQASGREWRTPPLWGLGLTEVVSGHTRFLHDGRARNLEEAILWHGGEAQAARDAYAALDAAQRANLISFLESL